MHHLGADMPDCRHAAGQVHQSEQGGMGDDLGGERAIPGRPGQGAGKLRLKGPGAQDLDPEAMVVVIGDASITMGHDGDRFDIPV